MAQPLVASPQDWRAAVLAAAVRPTLNLVHGVDGAITESLTWAFLRCLLVKRRGASG
jgi:hypothetical protein